MRYARRLRCFICLMCHLGTESRSMRHTVSRTEFQMRHELVIYV